MANGSNKQVIQVPGAGGSSTFLGLSDTPDLYTGQALKGTRVNAGETALEFFTLGGGTGTVTSVSSTTTDATVANSTTTPAITIVSAPKLNTARTINGVAFDGTANITVADTTKEPIVTAGTIAQYYRGDKTMQTLDKTAVGLGNVDNTSDVNKPVSTATQTAINNATIGLLDDRGNYNASVNTFPATGGSGTAGAVLKGDLWTISVAGTLGGVAVTAGDVVRSLIDTPAQVASNWAISENNIGYVAENQANKDNTTTLGTSTTLYPTQNAVKVYADTGLATKQASDAGLTALSALIGAGYVKETATDTFALVTTIPNTDITGLGTLSTQSGTFTAIPQANVTNLVSDLALKAPLASPTFTGTVVLPTSQILTTPVINGIPTGTGVSSSNAGNTIVLRQASGYSMSNNNITVSGATATAGGTTALSGSSFGKQLFTGTLNQTVTLPGGGGIYQGTEYEIVNQSTGVITVQTATAVFLLSIPSGASALFTSVVNSDLATSWSIKKEIVLTTTGSGAATLIGSTLNIPTPSAGTGDMVLASIQTVSGLKTFLDTKFALRNVADTFSGLFTNTNTADRTYTLKDSNGTIAFTSDITGTNSGTNTGDVTLAGTPNYITIAGQVITRSLIDLTTHVTGLLPFANIANVATSTVMYRKTAGTGALEAQTLATLKTDLALTGTNSGDQTSIVGITGTLAQFNTAITDADIAPTSRLINTTAPLSGGGDLSADRTLTTSMNTNKLIGRGTAGIGVMEEITLGTNLSLTGTTLNASGGGVTDGDKGDITVTGTGTVWTIDPNVVTNAKSAQMATNTIKGNNTGVTANALDLTATQTTAILDTMVGATGIANGTKGLVPQPLIANQLNYLRGDGTWAMPAGAGTVTTVSVVTANGVSGSVATPTSTPAITLTLGDIVPTSIVSSGNIRAPKIGINKANSGNAMLEILNNAGLQGEQIENDIATRIAFSSFITGDAFVRFTYLGDGKQEWGSGAVVADTNLYRGGANILTTDDLFEARGGLRVGTTSVVGKAVTFSDTAGNTTSSYPAQYNTSVASQTGFAADTYLVGSSIAIPASSLKAKSIYKCKFNVVKTAAGTATPIINIRFGTAGTTADTSRGALTFSAQTGVVDEGTYELNITFRTVGGGTSAIIQSLGQLYHRLSITGLGVGVSEPKIATSGGFDSTVANSIIGLSVNGGASAAWTIEIVQAELLNLV